MRLTFVLGLLALVGCVGPHSSGGLWAQRNQELDTAPFRATDSQRAEQTHAFELGLADEALAAERARIDADLASCPGATRQPLGLSRGDRARDGIRIRVQGDLQRLTSLAQVALADWRLRRGLATSDARFCDAARQALAGQSTAASAAIDPLSRLGSATVVRDAARAQVAAGQGSPADIDEAIGSMPTTALSLYALGAIDTVRAAVPLPQYLAAVYGGAVLERATPDLNGRPPEVMVDDLAPSHPEWEPDAIYEALRQR